MMGKLRPEQYVLEDGVLHIDTDDGEGVVLLRDVVAVHFSGSSVGLDMISGRRIELKNSNSAAWYTHIRDRWIEIRGGS